MENSASIPSLFEIKPSTLIISCLARMRPRLLFPYRHRDVLENVHFEELNFLAEHVSREQADLLRVESIAESIDRLGPS